MKKIKLFSVLAALFAALSFTSCNTDSDSTSLPDAITAKSMLSKVSGFHNCGILLPAGTNVESKDSVEATYYVNANDSSFVISSFPISKLAKYFSDEDLANAVAKLPDQNLTGKLLPYSADGPTFGSYVDPVKFNANGKEYTLAFYYGYTSLTLAGYATIKSTGKQLFLQYLTLGGVYEGSSSTPLSNALKTTTNSYGYSLPFTFYLMYNL